MTQELILERKVEDEKNTARLLYMVHGLTFIFTLGLLSIIPLIFNYIKRGETQGTMVYSHHSWMIRSFWWYAGWIVVGWVVLLFSFGLLFFVSYAIWGLAWLWKAYRLIRGFIDLNTNTAMA
jgi:uncharacterized membrane protein